MEAIRQHGPGVSIDDIAASAEVSKPVLYGHFGDKLGLADAIAVTIAEAATDHTTAVLEDEGSIDLRVAMGAIVGSLVDLVEDEPEIYGFLVRTIRTGERGFFDNALVEVIRERGGRLAVLAGPDADPDMLGVLVDGAFGFLFFAIESWQLTRTPPRDELVDVLSQVVVAGFSAAADVPSGSAPRR